MMKSIQLATLCLIYIISTTGCIAKEGNKWVNMDNKHEESFLREYSNEHLQKHPNQTIQKIVIEIDHFPSKAKKNIKDEDYINTDLHDIDQALVGIYVKHKNLPNWYTQGGTCRKPIDSNTYECYVDGDGGNFTLTLNDNNKLVLAGNARIDMCGIVWEEQWDKIENAAIGLENSKGKEEIYNLNPTSKTTFENILKNSNCI